MANQITSNLQLNAPLPLDNRSGVLENGVWRPYDSLSEFYTRQPPQIRFEGLAFLVKNPDDENMASLYIIGKDLEPYLYRGQKGDTGLSAYEEAVLNGFVGTEEQWLQSLKQPAIDAAIIADAATLNANNAANLANTATNNANNATNNANQATNNANNAADNADDATENAIIATNNANIATGNANTATNNANNATNSANTAANNANIAKDNAIIATNEALNAAMVANNARGWNPILSVVNDGTLRRVLQLTGWDGGTGTEPTDFVGMYLSETGFTSNIAEANNIMGAPGISTTNMTVANRILGKSTGATVPSTPEQLEVVGGWVENGKFYGGTIGGSTADETRKRFIRNPIGGMYASNVASATGVIRIKLPTASQSLVSFCRIKGTIASRSLASTPILFTIDYYPSSFSQYYGALIQNGIVYDKIAVRGYSEVDGTKYIYIGDLTSYWEYPRIVIESIEAGFNGLNTEALSSGWEISIQSSFSGTLQWTVADARSTFNPNQVMSDYVAGVNTPFLNTDTLNQILGKAQGQINERVQKFTTSFTFVESDVTTGYKDVTISGLTSTDILSLKPNNYYKNASNQLIRLDVAYLSGTTARVHFYTLVGATFNASTTTTISGTMTASIISLK